MRSPLLWLALAAATTACTVEGSDSSADAGAPDAFAFPDHVDAGPRRDGGGSAGVDATQFDAAVPACLDSVSSRLSGHHNAGQPCLDCHGDFGAAGTLFSNAQGDSPIVGSHVQIIDANGKLFEMVTATNGNFWTRDRVKEPVTAFTSDCPTLILMGSPAPSGNCNQAGCHDAGSRIHLP